MKMQINKEWCLQQAGKEEIDEGRLLSTLIQQIRNYDEPIRPTI